MLLAQSHKRWALSLAVGAGVLGPAGAAPSVACAGEGERAALVIDTGKSDTRLCVQLDDDSVTGLELIALAGEQHGLDYHLGYGGQAVCMLAGVGPTGDDCFEQYPDFWGYWQGDGSGGWTWSNSGAAATTVEDGDVEGWTWGSGDGPESHPLPPPTEFSEVCTVEEAAEEEAPGPSPPPEVEPSPTPAPEQSAAGDTDARTRPRWPRSSSPESRDRRWYEGRLVAEVPPLALAPSPSPSLTVSPGPPDLAAEPSADEGPPAAGIVAMVGVVVLAGLGLVLKRSFPK